MSLQRDRLTALLTDQALTSVELVIAPPGYGKTTVLRDYAAHDDEAVLVALPEATDLESFVRAVIAVAAPTALRSVGAVFDGRSGTVLEEHAGEWLVSRLRAFSGTLIVDDFHRAAADERVTRVLIAAIAATHGRMRWMIASREAPRFPMGSWIARGWMGLPISAEDLRFTHAEAAALAESLNVGASDDEIGAIVDDTLGWPIGVRLALSLVARKRIAGQTRMQTRDALFALIGDEVWQPLAPELQRLLSAAALLPMPSIATLAASGFADARAGITAIFEKVPFVQPTGDDTFIIHDLFREFVTSREASGEPALDVETRIAGALVGGGNPADGLRLFIATGNVADVEATLAAYAFDLLETGHRAALNAAVAFLFEHGRTDHGVSLAVRGALALADGSPTNAANLATRALERGLPAAMRGDVVRRLALNYVARGMSAEACDVLEPARNDESLSFGDRLEVQSILASIAQALGTIAPGAIAATIASIEGQLPQVAPASQARILQRLGYTAFTIGDLDNAERLSIDCVALATSLGMDMFAALAYGTLYGIAINADGDTRRARSFLRSMSSAAERASNTALRVYALRGEFTAGAYNGEIAEVDALDVELSRFADSRVYRDTFSVRIARAMYYVAAGEPRRAQDTLGAVPKGGIATGERAYRAALVSVLQLINGDRDGAIASLERGLVASASLEYWDRSNLLLAYALRAVAYWALDRPAQSRKSFGFDATQLPLRERILVDALRSACKLPHPLPNTDAIDMVCRPLLDSDNAAFAALLRALVGRDANDIALSAAEIATLREFDRGGRAADVAKALGKSRFTVQNQIQSVIKKIGVSGRAEALAYARKRGWLDEP